MSKPGTNIIKLLRPQFTNVRNKVERLSFPGKPFQPRLMFLGKAKSQPQSGAHRRCLIRVGSGLTHKHQIILKGFAVENTLAYYEHSLITAIKTFYNNWISDKKYKHAYGCKVISQCVLIKQLLSFATKSHYRYNTLFQLSRNLHSQNAHSIKHCFFTISH